MFCPNCHSKIIDEAHFCPICGHAVSLNNNSAKDNDLHDVFYNIANTINKAAGVDTPSELRLSEIFSKAFKRHSEEEAENLFIVGTSQTTPPVEAIADTWPKPWLFARVFIAVAICYLGLYVGLSSFENLNFLPGLITMGSFMVPFSLLIFFWEINAPQNIPIYRVVKMVFIGGILSLVITVFLFEGFGNLNGAIVTGIVEETAKVLALLWFLKDKKHKYILNGLLIGAAIGTGFAAFESSGYALRTALNEGIESMYQTIFLRAILAPGGHIVWAALSGAALMMVKGDKTFNLYMLRDFRFLRIFVIVVLLHSAWDLPIPMVSNIPVLQIVLTLISWVVAFSMMNTGLKELYNFKNHNTTVHLQQ